MRDLLSAFEHTGGSVYWNFEVLFRGLGRKSVQQRLLSMSRAGSCRFPARTLCLPASLDEGGMACAQGGGGDSGLR